MTVKISKKPNYIVLTKFDEFLEIIEYHLDKLDTINKNCDFGVWKIKYKN